MDERFAQSDHCGSADVDRDQSGRHRISACACWVGYRDGGNWLIPRRGDPRLCGSSLAVAGKARADVADVERDLDQAPGGWKARPLLRIGYGADDEQEQTSRPQPREDEIAQ